MRQLLGNGLQFAVYDYGGKVLKVPLSREEMKAEIIRREPYYEKVPGKLENRVKRLIEEWERSFDRLRLLNVPGHLLGNPIFLHDGSFFQDKVTPLGKKLHELVEDHRIFDACELIDQLVDFVVVCWKYGFSEASYNITMNYGINSFGSIVLMDFGELFFSQTSVANSLKNKVYASNWCFTHDLPSILREYTRKKMDEVWTLDNLAKYWHLETLHSIRQPYLPLMLFPWAVGSTDTFAFGNSFRSPLPSSNS